MRPVLLSGAAAALLGWAFWTWHSGPSTSQTTLASNGWIEAEFQVTRARTPTDAVMALAATRIDGLADELKGARVPSRDQMDAISGDFTGEVVFQNGAPPWQIEWHVEARLDNGEPKGKREIKLSQGGKIISQIAGDGAMPVRAGGGQSNAIFVPASAETGWFQLYPMEKEPTLVGNYYEKKGQQQFIPSGTVILRRR
jgi:hypothetical protein